MRLGGGAGEREGWRMVGVWGHRYRGMGYGLYGEVV